MMTWNPEEFLLRFAYTFLQGLMFRIGKRGVIYFFLWI